MIKKRFLLPAAAGALALTIGLTGIWFNQQLPALADFGVSGMDSEAQLMAWAALFPEKGVAALTFRTVLQWMAIAVFCTLGAVVLALYRYKPQKELGYFLLYLTVLTLWALVIILAPVGSSGWSVFFRRGFFTVTVLAGILLCAALTGAVPVSHGQRLHSLLLTLGYLVLTLIPLSRVRAAGLLLGMGYCLGILMAMYARGSDAALLMLFPCAITIGFRVWVVLPGMHVPFFQESVFFYLFRCARIYDAPFTLGCMAYVCRRYALQFDRAEQLARELDARVIQRTKALTEETEARKSMMLNIFHDLRSPLFAVSSGLDTLEAAPEALPALLPALQQRTAFLRRLTEDLFLAAKLEQKQVMLNEDRVSLGEVIAAVCDSCREEAEKKGVVLQGSPGFGAAGVGRPDPAAADPAEPVDKCHSLHPCRREHHRQQPGGGRCCSGERPGHGLRHCAGRSGRCI